MILAAGYIDPVHLGSYLVAGFVSGVFSGGLGVGGAVIATPLIRFLGTSALLAIGTTVPAILPSTLTGAFTYWRAGLVSKPTILWVASSASVTSVLGAIATRLIPGQGHILMLVTAGLLFVLSVRTLAGKHEMSAATEPQHSRAGLLALGAVTGVLSGLLGVGGGFIMVPAFINIFKMPVKTALGTSLAVITLTALPNIAAQAAVGNIDWRVAGLLALGVVPGARVGSLLAIRAPERKLKTIVGLALAVIAVVYAIFEISQLGSR